MNRSQSPINNSRNHSASKRYVSPNERQNTQENEQNHKKLPPTQQVKSKIINIDQQSDISSVLGEVNINNTSKMSNMTQFANFMYVPCPTHPEFFITNLCQDQSSQIRKYPKSQKRQYIQNR
ncbi:unnamed protein product [Paramecium primaurelia]|uniref:Uncharacterized protein n=1 Tax=Paramecium primaurelia TaxID=5886 RepID=A0A8S1PS87_PARPR|nr:unnamed protein product [Paramecium primaurelia]